MLGAALTRAGYDVVSVADGREALGELRRGSIQLVVCDWEMPHLSGVELCRAVRSTGWDRYIYVIMLTSHDRPDDVLAGLEAGADEFVSKPLRPAEIAVRLRVGERLLTLGSAELTIFLLARLAESRDPETGEHLERVREYSRILAISLSRSGEHADHIDGEFVQLIYQTSPLHDIGKVAIPDEVLLKPDRLTDREFEIMKEHTLHGARTLEAAIQRYPHARYLRMAREIALTHHEKFDGTGYPLGLAGSDIPLAGRIVAIADVYDALTSRRVYKGAYPHERAHEMILEQSGIHFDPAIVRAYLQNERLFAETRQRFGDRDLLLAA
ncbi:MAG: response regulator [Phycisphaerales bacterium]|nr:response regulator [Phycisphaerales bacterium]